MTFRSVMTHVAAALVAFGIGWQLAPRDAEPGSASSFFAATGDPSATLVEILRIDDARERATQLASFFDATDPSMAPLLRDLLVDPDAGLIVDETVESLFAQWWAEADPQAAFAATVNPRWTERHPWMRQVLRAWSRKDPVAAAIAVIQIPNGPSQGRIEAARVVVDEWLALDEMPDPTPLLAVIKQLEPMARGGALGHLVSTMLKEDGIDATLDFVRSVPPDKDGLLGGSVQHEILARTGVALLDHDVDRAVDWAREQADGPNGIGVQKHLAYYWGIRDGRAAMEWAISLPDSAARPAIIKRAWISFGRKHPDEAREWLTARRPDEMLQSIYARHIRTVAETDPERALALAERAVDDEIRQHMFAAAARGWMKSDPEAASAWLAEAGLPAELERQIRAGARSPKS